MVRLLLEDNKEYSRKYKRIWNSENGFEIEEGQLRFIVDILRKTCTCRSWQLRGIPCAHAVCAYYHINEEPDIQVEKWYRKHYFLRACQYVIQPIPNLEMWHATNNPTIEPPEPKVMPKRSKRYRRKDKDEPKKKYGKWSRKGVKMTYSRCH